MTVVVVAAAVIVVAVGAFALWGASGLFGGGASVPANDTADTVNSTDTLTDAGGENASTDDETPTPANDSVEDSNTTDEGGTTTQTPADTPTETETPTETPSDTETPTETPTDTPTETDDGSSGDGSDSASCDVDSTPDDGTHTLVIDGQSSDVSGYKVTVSGEITPVRGGTANDELSADGSTLSGKVSDGYDSYKFTGELHTVTIDGKALVKVDDVVVAKSGGATDQRPNCGDGYPYAVSIDNTPGPTPTVLSVDGHLHENIYGEYTRYAPSDVNSIRAHMTSYGSGLALSFEKNDKTLFSANIEDMYGEAGFEFNRSESIDGEAITGDYTISSNDYGVLFIEKVYRTDDGVLTTMTKTYPGENETTTIEGSKNLIGFSVTAGYPQDGQQHEEPWISTFTTPNGSTQTKTGSWGVTFTVGTEPSYDFRQ